LSGFRRGRIEACPRRGWQARRFDQLMKTGLDELNEARAPTAARRSAIADESGDRQHADA
jgi:hypothetical protein